MADWTLAVDIGTHVTTAAVDPGSGPVPLSVDDGPLPSVVCVNARGELMAGPAAATAAVRSPELAQWYPMRALAQSPPLVRLGSRDVPAAELVATLLVRVLAAGAARFGGVPTRLVLTHPAQWGEVELARLVAAGERAARVTPVLVPGQVAVARWYGGAVPVGDHVGVLDFGATLRTAILRRTRAGFTLVGPPTTDADLGGDALTGELADLVAAAAVALDPTAWDRLRQADDQPARLARAGLRAELTGLAAALVTGEAGTLEIPEFPAGLRVSRAQFAARAQPLVQRAAAGLAAAGGLAGITPDDLVAVYLAGAASASPVVAGTVARQLGVAPQVAADPGVVAALGALTRVWLPGPVPAAPLARTPTSSLSAGRDPGAGPLPTGTVTPADTAAPAELAVPDGPAAGWRPWATQVPGGAAVFGYADGTLYVAGSRVCALELGTGTARWTGQPVPPLHQLTVAGAIVCGHDGTRVLALDRSSGVPRWAHQATGPLAVDADAVHLAGRRAVLCLDPATGRERWRTALAADLGGLAVPGDGRVYPASTDGRLRALAADTGEELWRVRLPAGPAAPALLAGAVYLAVRDGVRAFAAESGEVLWHTAERDGAGTVLVTADQVYVVGAGVRAYGAVGGEPRWRTGTGSSFTALPAVGEGVVCGPVGAALVAFDVTTGQQRWTVPTGTAVVAPPVLAAGLAHVVWGGRGLAAISVADGTVRWRTELPGLVAAGPLLVAGVLMVAARAGYGTGTTVYAIDARTGLLSGSAGRSDRAG